MYITKEVIDLNQFMECAPECCGASVLFVGRVRNHHRGKKVRRLFYECYEPMAENQICVITEQISRRFPIKKIRVIHRVGWLDIGDIAVVIEVHASHREEGFQACRMTIEEIKKTVPIWKKEIYEDSTQGWVNCEHN